MGWGNGLKVSVVKNILEAMDTVLRFMADLCEQRNDVSFLRTCLNYLFRADTNVDKQALFRKLEFIENNTIKEQTMSIADVLIEHGIEKGMEKGMEKGIERGMEKGIERGMEKGIEKGIEKGRQEALVRQIGTLQDILGNPAPDFALLNKLTIQELELQLVNIQSELKRRLN